MNSEQGVIAPLPLCLQESGFASEFRGTAPVVTEGGSFDGPRWSWEADGKRKYLLRIYGLEAHQMKECGLPKLLNS